MGSVKIKSWVVWEAEKCLPKDAHRLVLIPEYVNLYSKSDCSCDFVKDLKMGKLSLIIWVCLM